MFLMVRLLPQGPLRLRQHPPPPPRQQHPRLAQQPLRQPPTIRCGLHPPPALHHRQPLHRPNLHTNFDDVNFRDYDHHTALHVASAEGHLDVVKFLVSKGAKINQSDWWGGSPLENAYHHHHTAVALFLRGCGGRMESTNITTNLIAAAATAAAEGDIKEVKMLLLGNEAVTAAVLTAMDGGNYLSVSLANGRALTAAANNHNG